MRIQEQYDIALQQVHNLMHQDFMVCNDIDERELVCELVELYEKIYYPMGDMDWKSRSKHFHTAFQYSKKDPSVFWGFWDVGTLFLFMKKRFE